MTWETPSGASAPPANSPAVRTCTDLFARGRTTTTTSVFVGLKSQMISELAPICEDGAGRRSELPTRKKPPAGCKSEGGSTLSRTRCLLRTADKALFDEHD